MRGDAFRSLPEAAEHFTVTAADGAVLPVYRLAAAGPDQAGEGAAPLPVLLFGHANGFAAGSYRPFLSRLTGVARVFAFDARGHGGSRWPAGPLADVFALRRFDDDLALIAAAVAARCRGAPLHYAGHSLNAAAALRLAARDGGGPAWASLTVFEPPVFPPPEAAIHAEAVALHRRLVERTALRRARWPSPDDLAAYLAERGIFRGFRPELLAAHCRATLRPAPDGGFTLCCPPAVEAAIFTHHPGAGTWEGLARIARPVHLVGGDPTLPDRDWISAFMPEVARCLPRARYTALRGLGHMMMFEAPETCCDLLLAALR